MNCAKVPFTVDRWTDGQGSKGISIKSADGLHIANMVMSLRDDELATARFLCRAANSHGELLEALKGLVGSHLATPGPRGVMVDIPHFLEQAEAAIRKAEGK